MQVGAITLDAVPALIVNIGKRQARAPAGIRLKANGPVIPKVGETIKRRRKGIRLKTTDKTCRTVVADQGICKGRQ